MTAAGSAFADGPTWVGAFFVKGKVGLKWQPVEGSREYRIYRKIGGASFENISTTNETQYFDEGLTPGQVHTYKIASVDASGEELFSDEKSVTVPAGSGASAFKAPTWSGLRTDRQGILLNWDRVKGAVGYNVYRSSTAGGPYDVLGNTPSNRHSDRDVEQGKTYYYVVTAMNEQFEETEHSEERSIKFGLTEEERAESDTTIIKLEPLKLTFLFAIDQVGDNSPINQPYDVFLNSKGDIYVSDTRRFRIDCFDPSGKFKFTFGEKTLPGDEENPPEGTFRSPMPLFIDKQDQVYVGDTENNDIQVFTADGKFLRRIRVEVKADEEAFRPNGLWVLDDGRIVATDAGNHRLLFLDQDGKILKAIRHGGSGASPESQLWLSFPAELAVSPDGVISVIDQMGGRVQQFDVDGNFIRSFGDLGYSAGQFGRPKGIIVGEDGKLWVSDGMANTVQVFTPDGRVKSAFTSFEGTEEKLTSPSGMFISGGRFYLVTRLTGKVLVFKIG